MYGWFHFFHVLGALGIAAAFAVETMGLVGLRRSMLADEAKIWLRARSWMTRLGPISLVLVLATGIYAVASGWGWQGWVQASMAGLLSLGLLGGLLTGIPMARVAPAIAAATGALTDDVRRRLNAPILTVSLATRIAIAIGIAFVMVKKPERSDAFLAVAATAACGAVAGWALGANRRGETP